jgi:hypothetical protein
MTSLSHVYLSSIKKHNFGKGLSKCRFSEQSSHPPGASFLGTHLISLATAKILKQWF